MNRAAGAAAAILAIFPACVLALPACDSPERYQQFYVEIDAFKDALKQKHFAELDAKLNAVLDDAQADRITDDEAQRWFERLFEKGQVQDEPLHQDWMAQYPKSRAAALAAAFDYFRRGTASRSSQFADKVSDTQFAAMRVEFDKAYPLLDKADSLGTPLSIAEALRLQMRTHASDLTQAAFQQRMAHDLARFPRSTALRLVWIYKGSPKWGGSLDDVAAVEKSIGSLPAAEQRYMRYKIAEQFGDAYEIGEKYAEAGRFYDIAVPFCPGFWGSLTAAMRVHEKSKSYDALIKDADIHIARYPRNGWAYVKRGWARSQKGEYEPSFHDYEIAASLGNANGFGGLAWFYETGHAVKQDYARAIDLYQEAADHGDKSGRENVERVKRMAAAHR